MKPMKNLVIQNPRSALMVGDRNGEKIIITLPTAKPRAVRQFARLNRGIQWVQGGVSHD